MSIPNDENKGSLVEADEPFVAIKSESGGWWKLPKALPKSPSLLRRGGRAAVVYALSYMLVKSLDKARQENPGNEVISSVDDIARMFFYFENLVVTGAVAVVKTGYDALAAKPLPEQAAAIPASTSGQADKTAKAEPKKPAKHKHHSNRANLNTTLAPEDRPTSHNDDSHTLVSDAKSVFSRYWITNRGKHGWFLSTDTKRTKAPKNGEVVLERSGLAKIDFVGDKGVSTPTAGLLAYKLADGTYFTIERFSGSEVMYFSGQKIQKPRVVK